MYFLTFFSSGSKDHLIGAPHEIISSLFISANKPYISLFSIKVFTSFNCLDACFLSVGIVLFLIELYTFFIACAFFE